MAEVELVKPDRALVQRLETAGGYTLQKCFQCATCSVVCQLSPEERPFPRKEMLWAGWGLRDRLAADPDIWLCHQCNDCTVRCPRGAKPGEVLAAVRSYIFEHFAFPRFLGSLLAKPAGLPLLLLLPVLVIGALMLVHTGGDFQPLLAGPVEYGAFIPHGYIEMLFIGGNVLIMLFAAVGLLRFYRMLDGGGSSQVGFIPALVSTLVEITTHKRFGSCDAGRYRRWAHLMVLFGFVGAMATAGLALIAMVVFNYGPPLPLSHPIKWLGNASGVAMLVGLGIIIVRRSTDSETAGRAQYGHWLFIWTIVVVAATGMALQALRILEIPQVAYPTYFIHLVAVFFLLWYAPYSQFGHMFYRTLAMVYAAGVGRKPRAVAAPVLPAVG